MLNKQRKPVSPWPTAFSCPSLLSPLIKVLLTAKCSLYPKRLEVKRHAPRNAEACRGSPFVLGFMVWADEDKWRSLFLKEKVSPSYEHRSLDSRSRASTITPQELGHTIWAGAWSWKYLQILLPDSRPTILHASLIVFLHTAMTLSFSPAFINPEYHTWTP